MQNIQVFRSTSLPSLLIVIGFHAFASDTVLDMNGPAIEREIESRLNRPLPSIEEILPAYKPPGPNSTSLVVGYFGDEGSDGHNWGFRISSLIRWKLASTPDVIVSMPPMEWTQFKENLSNPQIPSDQVAKSLDSLRLAYDRYGIKNALSGDVVVSDTTFEIQIHVHQIPDRTILLDRRYPGARGEMVQTLSKICLDVLKILEIDLNASQVEFISQPSPMSDGFLLDMFEFQEEYRSLDNKERYERAQRLWNQDHNCPYFIEFYLYSLWFTKDDLEKPFDHYMVEAVDRFPTHEGVLETAERYLTHFGSEVDTEGIANLYTSIADNDQFSAHILMDMANHYLLVKDDPLSAFRLSIQAVTDFPDYYQGWTMLSFVARKGAHLIDFDMIATEETPESEDLFEYLDRVDLGSIDRALKIFPDSSTLWRVRMYQNYQRYGVSPQQMKAFREAIECGPEITSVYQMLFKQLREGYGDYIENGIEGLQAAAMNIPKKNSVYRDFFKQFGNELLEDWEGTREEFETIEQLNEVAKVLVIQNQRLDLAHLALWMFMCTDDKVSGAALLMELLEWYQERGTPPTYYEWTFSEYALSFGRPDIAEGFEARFEDASKIWGLNKEDHVAAFETVVKAELGEVDSAKTILEERMLRSEDNVFSMLRYLELGIRNNTDPESRQHAIRYLIDFAPNPIEYLHEDLRSKEPLDRNLYPIFYQDLLRALAKGHLASAEGRHEDAVTEYDHAKDAYKYLQKQSKHCLPEVLPHLVRESRRMAGLE